MNTDNEEMYRGYVTLSHYAFDCTLDVVFIRNMYNNIVIEQAIYKTSTGATIYAYYDDKSKISTIQPKNLDIPQEKWDNAERHIPKRTIYYKLRQFAVDVYDFCDVWELIGKTISKTFYFNSRFFIVTNDGEYSIADVLLENNLQDELGATFTNVEVAKVTANDDYELRITTTKGTITVFGDEYVENSVRITAKESKAEYKLYDENLGQFIE